MELNGKREEAQADDVDANLEWKNWQLVYSWLFRLVHLGTFVHFAVRFWVKYTCMETHAKAHTLSIAVWGLDKNAVSRLFNIVSPYSPNVFMDF